MKLFELRQLPKSSNASELEKFIRDNVKLKYGVWFDQPSKVWTRGDGSRYKDAPYLKFGDNKDAQAAWKFLTSLNHTEVTVAGPFGSSRSEGIMVDDRIFIDPKSGNRIEVYSKQTVQRSPVYHLVDDGDSTLFWMLGHLLKTGKKVASNLKSGKLKFTKNISSLDDRTITFDDGSLLTLPIAADQLYTIKTIDGVPTLVNK